MKTKPFHSAESAFFWFIRSRESMRPASHNKSVECRPCEPADILRAIERLLRDQTLNRQHYEVLNEYGNKGCPPREDFNEEISAYRLWTEAMHRLEVALRERGIVVAGRVMA